MYELPLFPLNLVLFPGMPLNLHIFEERYKQMIRECRSKGQPFGVVLIRRGAEAGGKLAVPYDFGCTAQITEVEPLEEGRFNLTGIGQDRFRIHSLKYDRPYLVGLVDDQPLLPGIAQDLPELEQSLRPWLEKYIQIIAQGKDVGDTLARIPHDPMVVAYLAAVILQIPAHQKQHFLEIGDCANLLAALNDAYRREVGIIRRIFKTMPPIGGGHFSRN